jgi:hypothetical protein
MICASTSGASDSALCCTMLPVMVIGDVAPPVGQGRLAWITPYFAISMIASAAMSCMVNGLTGESERVSSSGFVPTTAAISTAKRTSCPN